MMKDSLWEMYGFCTAAIGLLVWDPQRAPMVAHIVLKLKAPRPERRGSI